MSRVIPSSAWPVVFYFFFFALPYFFNRDGSGNGNWFSYLMNLKYSIGITQSTINSEIKHCETKIVMPLIFDILTGFFNWSPRNLYSWSKNLIKITFCGLKVCERYFLQTRIILVCWPVFNVSEKSVLQKKVGFCFKVLALLLLRDQIQRHINSVHFLVNSKTTRLWKMIKKIFSYKNLWVHLGTYSP